MDDIISISIITVIMFVSLVFFAIWYSNYSCHKMADVYNTTCEYNWAIGCFLKHEGRFLPYAEYEKLLTPNYQMGNAEVKVKIQDYEKSF